MQKRMLSFKFIQYLYCFPGKPLYILFCLLQPLKCHIGCLLIFRITADRLTEFFKRSRDIENIILNLKGKSQLCSGFLHTRNRHFIRACQNGSDPGLKEGDVITAICGQSLDTIEEFRQLLAENGEDAAALTVKRGSRTIELSAEPEKDEDGEYRLGAWVRDSMAGIGTMTFFDPQSGTFGALGHGVTDVDTGQLLPLDHGSIMDASVKAVKKGERASPGELKGDFDLTRDSGTLYANTECGIFGKLSAEDAAKITGAALPIAKKDEIKTGKATILATVSGNETREYDIEIEKIYSPSGSTRNLLLRVTDEELLAQTGGVVQGMSGSAILQDGKIIGAVTHVLLDDPSRGYGIFIENMLSAAGLSSE